MFQIKKNPNKIIILATGSGWELVPRETDNIIYALNDYIRIEKYQIKPDILFMMDILDEKPQVVSGQDNLNEMVKRINDFKIPFVGPYKYAEIPLSVAFPIKDCVQQFGLPYFTNTICYMIAFALLNKAKEINIYGVNQAGSHEYTEERGGVEYWIGIAIGLGVKVIINGSNSQLLRYKGRYGRDILYGYLQSYKEILYNEQKFGTPIIRKLTSLPKPESRIVRKVDGAGYTYES